MPGLGSRWEIPVPMRVCLVRFVAFLALSSAHFAMLALPRCFVCLLHEPGVYKATLTYFLPCMLCLLRFPFRVSLCFLIISLALTYDGTHLRPSPSTPSFYEGFSFPSSHLLTLFLLHQLLFCVALSSLFPKRLLVSTLHFLTYLPPSSSLRFTCFDCPYLFILPSSLYVLLIILMLFPFFFQPFLFSSLSFSSILFSIYFAYFLRVLSVLLRCVVSRNLC